jgi:hypothetical protein
MSFDASTLALNLAPDDLRPGAMIDAEATS